MLLISRALFTLVSITLSVGALVADYSDSHIFNPQWPPHAKFHTGMTMSLAVLLALLTLIFTWRRVGDSRTNVLAATGFASLYWIAQATAILYPNTGYFDPETLTSSSYVLGIPLQIYLIVVHLVIIGIASTLALRSLSKKHHQQPVSY